MSCCNEGCDHSADTFCSACHIVKYCSKECQKVCWPSHKKICKGVILFIHKPFTPYQ